MLYASKRVKSIHSGVAKLVTVFNAQHLSGRYLVAKQCLDNGYCGKLVELA